MHLCQHAFTKHPFSIQVHAMKDTTKTVADQLPSFSYRIINRKPDGHLTVRYVLDGIETVPSQDIVGFLGQWRKLGTEVWSSSPMERCRNYLDVTAFADAVDVAYELRVTVTHSRQQLSSSPLRLNVEAEERNLKTYSMFADRLVSQLFAEAPKV